MTDFQNTWDHPSLRHALLVHWPVVLSVLAVFFVLAMAINRAKNPLLRTLALLMCLGVMISGYIAMQSGENAEHAVPTIVEAAEHTLEEHEELAEKVPYFGAICSAVVALTFIPRKAFRIGASWLAVLICGFNGAWIANTAHHGGLLVYEHGVGVARASDAAPSALPTSPPITGMSDDPSVKVFIQTVQPILNDRCVRCHNPEKVLARKSGGLDQSSFDGLMKGGKSGPAVVPGKPEESLLIQRVRQEISGDDRMPPPPGEPLSPQQITAIEEWIRGMTK